MHTPSASVNDEQKSAVIADEKRWNTRALIVDDDVPIRELLIDYLARFNILASGVTDGAWSVFTDHRIPQRRRLRYNPRRFRLA